MHFFYFAIRPSRKLITPRPYLNVSRFTARLLKNSIPGSSHRDFSCRCKTLTQKSRKINVCTFINRKSVEIYFFLDCRFRLAWINNELRFLARIFTFYSATFCVQNTKKICICPRYLAAVCVLVAPTNWFDAFR